MFRLNEEAKKAIQRTVGLSVEELAQSSFNEEDFIEKQTGTPLHFPARMDQRKRGRGNPYLALGRITRPEEIEKKAKAIR